MPWEEVYLIFFRKAGLNRTKFLYIKGIKVFDGSEVQRQAGLEAVGGRKLETADER